MELRDLVGEHILDAVDYCSEAFKEKYGEQMEDCRVVRFRLDGKVYTAAEDPSDGYRSCMRGLLVGGEAKMNVFPPVRVVGEYRGEGEYGSAADILRLVDCMTKKVVLEVGTDNADDYYPRFVACFMPENMALNVAVERVEAAPRHARRFRIVEDETR